MFNIGDEVVVFYGGYPLQHNSEHNKSHPTRGKILKVGRKFYSVESTDTPIKAYINEEDSDSMITVHTVEEAKELHRKNFGAPDEYLTPEFIESVIEEL